MIPAILGVDIGTSSSKGVIVTPEGRILRTAVRTHAPDRPQEGHVEMEGNLWWSEFVSITEELTAPGDVQVVAVGVSGMGPCVLVTDRDGEPLRPAILYGVDTRSTLQIERMTARFGASEMLHSCGSTLTTQAVGPKLVWLTDHEPELMRRARRMYMPSSWLVYKLTGEYALDRHSASQCTPLFDRSSLSWNEQRAREIAPWLELPRLAWPADVAGVTREPIGGVGAGVPVIVGTIDAWSESLSVGAHRPGDLMLMYGTTMFLIATSTEPMQHESMWGTVGVLPGTWNLAGGMSASGAITGWIGELTGGDYAALSDEAAVSGLGANGLLMLPYFAGERTPIMDPDARGAIVGLTLSHARGDLYRAALEATALGVRHNVETMLETGVSIERVVAVGGGTKSRLWTQIVSDATGLVQETRDVAIGASYGSAYLAALGIDATADIDAWNPVSGGVTPRSDTADFYAHRYELYRSLYAAAAPTMHMLAQEDRRAVSSIEGEL